MSLYHSQHLGKTEFYFWYGQVVGGVEWECNHDHTIHNRDDPKGWGYRVKVAIFGSDPRIVTEDSAKNSELVMAEVMLPTTGGGGIGGPITTPSIGNNSFVVGFYKDGIDAREPIIMGILPNISQSRLNPYQTTEEVRYDAASGYDNTRDEVATSGILSNPSGQDVLNETSNSHIFNVETSDQYFHPILDGVARIPVSHRCTEEGGELKGVQGFLQDAMKYITFVQNQSSNFAASVSDLSKGIDNIIDRAANLVTALIKIMVTKIRELTINYFERAVQYFIDLTPPNLRAQVVDGVKAETDILSCIFSKIIAGLLELVKKIVKDLLDKAVNALACTAENLVGNVLANILGEITEGISSAVSGISNILGGVVEFANDVFDALSFIFGILNILTCQEEYACPNVEEWNYWYGQQDGSDPVSKEIDKVLKTLASGEATVTACSSGPIIAGAPKIKAKGGKKKKKNNNQNEEFAGNAIVSNSGEIIAVDIINSGSGYNKPPILIVEDKGGNGSGAVLQAVLNDNGGVSDVIILDSGAGYLSRENGSTGIGGLQYSSPVDTIVFSTTTGYSKYPPNTNVPVIRGDLIYLPAGSTAEIYDNEGNLAQSSLGLGPSDPIIVLESGTLGTPNVTLEDVEANYPTSSNNTYPIVLEIKDTFIKNPGFNYTETDLIIIEPSNGAQLIPTYGEFGSLQSVEIANPGIGFTEIPRIFIQSRTGINARIIPIFNVNRIGDLAENEDLQNVSQESIIDIVDCVGIVPPNTTFDRVPQ